MKKLLVLVALILLLCQCGVFAECATTHQVITQDHFDTFEEALDFAIKHNGVQHKDTGPKGGYWVRYAAIEVVTGLKCPDNVRAYYEQ